MYATRDVDVLDVNEDLLAAFERARAETGQQIPESRVGIYTAPRDFEDRWTLLDLGLARLEVFVPERHDLAIMKVARADEHDLQAIDLIHRRLPLDLPTLVERYRTTLPFVIGSMEMFKLSFLALVERLFGEGCALQVEAELER